MKKRILSLTMALLICAVSLFAMAACSFTPGGNTPCAQCTDANEDHKCDVCKKTVSSCTDGDSDHPCDLCGKTASSCADKNGDHLCDVCGEHNGTDSNKDHVCDFGCATPFGEHTDADKDHECDYGCSVAIGECTDADGDGDHACDYGCGQEKSTCADEADSDGLCDECGKPVSAQPPADPENPGTDPENPLHYCLDADNNHECDVCRERISECFDSVTSTGEFSICCICGTRLPDVTGADDSELIENEYVFLGVSLRNDGAPTDDVFLPFFRDFYDLYFVFSVKTTEIQSGAFDYGTVSYDDGYMKNGRWIVPAKVNATDSVTSAVPGSYALPFQFKYEGLSTEDFAVGSVNLHITPNCNSIPAFLGASLDGNPENASKFLTVQKSALLPIAPNQSFYVYYHFDRPICLPEIEGDAFVGSSVLPYSFDYGIYTVRQEIRLPDLGRQTPDISFVYGPSLTLVIELKDAIVIEALKCDECTDENGDELCDDCNEPFVSEEGGEAHQCADANKDHACDNGCAETIGEHDDQNRDHTCDYGCAETIGEHLDADKNHACDYDCNDPIGEHGDTDRDHACDYGCTEFFGECTDDPTDGDHACDWGCGQMLSECAFENGICSDCGASSGTDTENMTYLEFVQSLKFNDSNCPVWRVAIAPDYAPYVFVNRALPKNAWFCGSEILFIMRLAKEMNYKVEFVPLSFDAGLDAVEQGIADAFISAAGNRDDITCLRSNVYAGRYYAYVSNEHDLSMINKAIDFIEAEGAYDLWRTATRAYVASLSENCLDTDGYDENGNKIGGNEDNLCAHDDQNRDHFCDSCTSLLSYCEDSDASGDCDLCSASMTALNNPAAAPVYLGWSDAIDGTYKTTGVTAFYNTGKSYTLFLKFSNAVTIDAFQTAGNAAIIENVQSEAGAYIYAATIQVMSIRVDSGFTGLYYKDAFADEEGEGEYFATLDYYRVPELVGMADENGTLLSGGADVSAGASITLRFITIGALNNFKLYLDSTELSYTLDRMDSSASLSGVQALSYGEADPYYIYTITFTDGDFIPLGENRLTLVYTLSGVTSSEGSRLPSITLSFTKHPANGEGGGEQITPPCASCTDGDLNGFCDACGQPVENEAHDCTDEADYDTLCDICYQPIAGIENLLNPYMIGYSPDPNGPFEEGGGLLLFEYCKKSPVYVKFNCPVELVYLSILENPIEEWGLVSEDESGCVYYFWTPDIDRIFEYAESEICFTTPYSGENLSVITYSCMPTEMPELLGMVENGEIVANPPTLLRGYTYTFSFALNVLLDSLDVIRSTYGGDLEIVDWEYTEGAEPNVYIYTVTVSDTMGSIVDGMAELSLYYTYLGTSNSETDMAFPPVFFLNICIFEPTPGAISVNGTDLNTSTQIPFSDSYIFSVVFTVPPTSAFIEIDGMHVEGSRDPMLAGTYHFVVNNLDSGYKQLYIHACNGDYVSMPVMLSIDILEEGIGGGGNEGGGENGGEGSGSNPEPETLPEILTVYNNVTEQPVEKNGIVYAWADGKISLDITFDREVAESYIRANYDFVGFGQYYDGVWSYGITHPMSSGRQELLLEICIFENGTETVIETLTCVIAAAEFYGLYSSPGVADLTKRPSGVQVAAGESASVWIAMTASVDPDELFIAGIDFALTPVDNPWYGEIMILPSEEYEGEEIRIWFYRVDIPAELLMLEEGMDSGVYKIAFEIYQGDYETIWMTYTVNFS